eukprot:Hpha_TRINITY_DN4576_c0_g1::TRINITY_DN4576_c0_g1_i1::g.115378::m.115378
MAVWFLVVATASAPGPGERALCPTKSKNPGGSAQCNSDGGVIPVKGWCAGECAGNESAIACHGYINNGNQPTCSGCCLPGSTCCSMIGNDKWTGGWKSPTGCCE